MLTKHELGIRLKTLRLAAGLTQDTAAKHTGVAPGTWAKWERGQGQPVACRLGDIAKALDTSVAAIYAPDTTIVLADLTITRLALERARAQGQPELERLTHLITSHVQQRLTSALEHTNGQPPKPRARRASVQGEQRQARRLQELVSRRTTAAQAQSQAAGLNA